MRAFYASEVSIALQFPSVDEDGEEVGEADDAMDIDQINAHLNEPPEAAAARKSVIKTMQEMQSVGLGGRYGQKVFAEVMTNLMGEYIRRKYSGKWSSPSAVPRSLESWIENVFARLVVEAVNCLQHDDISSTLRPHENGRALSTVVVEDVIKWKEIGIDRLGKLRVDELFDIIVEWDSSKGALEDLKASHYHPISPKYRLMS